MGQAGNSMIYKPLCDHSYLLPFLNFLQFDDCHKMVLDLILITIPVPDVQIAQSQFPIYTTSHYSTKMTLGVVQCLCCLHISFNVSVVYTQRFLEVKSIYRKHVQSASLSWTRMAVN